MKFPVVAAALWLLGGLAIATGAVTAGQGLAIDRLANQFIPGLSLLIAGLLLVAFGSVLDRLYRIERHLRPESKAEPRLPKIGLL